MQIAGDAHPLPGTLLGTPAHLIRKLARAQYVGKPEEQTQYERTGSVDQCGLEVRRLSREPRPGRKLAPWPRAAGRPHTKAIIARREVSVVRLAARAGVL